MCTKHCSVDEYDVLPRLELPFKQVCFAMFFNFFASTVY